MTPQQKWKLNNPEKVKELSRKYYLKNKEIILQKEKEKRLGFSEGYSRDKHYKHKYKISLLEFNSLVEKQQGVCAICKREETAMNQGKVSPLCVDHCHSTNTIRGLLCRNCNSALGKFKDSPDILKSAIQYLNGNK